MSKLLIAMFITAGLGFAAPVMAQTTAPTATPASPSTDTPAPPSADTPAPPATDSLAPPSKDSHDAAPKAKVRVAKDDVAARAKCDLYSGPAKETCISDAKGEQDKPLDKCDGFAGAAKDSCLKNDRQ
jgi:hypothetical protein